MTNKKKARYFYLAFIFSRYYNNWIIYYKYERSKYIMTIELAKLHMALRREILKESDGAQI